MPVLKGAFIKIDAGLLGFLPNVLVFQFNPESMSRSPSIVEPPSPADGSGPRETGAQPGEPSESISFTLRMDATDQLAQGDPVAAATGILPQLSALELLQFATPPPSVQLIPAGDAPYQSAPSDLPPVLFFWGPNRILPVTVTSLSIEETEYDQQLTPIRAEVSVTLSVLTPSTLPTSGTTGPLLRGAYNYTQRAREALAAANLARPPDVITRTLSTL